MLLLGVLLVSFHLASSSSEFPLARRNVFGRQMTNSSINPVFSTLCIPQYGQPFVNDAAECGLHTLVETSIGLCGKNSKGQLCYEIDDASKENAREQCLNPPERCTNSCRDALLAYRSDFGCCVNVGADFIQSDELWRGCGVPKPVFCNEGTLEFPVVNEELLCSEDEREGEIMFYEQFVCSGESGQVILDDVITSGVGADYHLYKLCGTDEFGQRSCYVAAVTDEIAETTKIPICDFLLNSTSEKFQPVCSDCSFYELVIHEHGCCAYGEIEDEILSVCGLEAPGQCNHTVFVNTATNNVNTATNNVPFVLALHILAVFAFMMV